jgi:hypothetical protein
VERARAAPENAGNRQLPPWNPMARKRMCDVVLHGQSSQQIAPPLH